MIVLDYIPQDKFLDKLVQAHADAGSTITRDDALRFATDQTARRSLALCGYCDISVDGFFDGENVAGRLTLDDVEVSNIEFEGGDNPSLDRRRQPQRDA